MLNKAADKYANWENAASSTMRKEGIKKCRVGFNHRPTTAKIKHVHFSVQYKNHTAHTHLYTPTGIKTEISNVELKKNNTTVGQFTFML